MSLPKRYAQQQAQARQRRRQTAHERLQRDHAQAQRAIEALDQALQDVGLPENLVKESAGRLRRPQKLLGHIFALMFPALCGCRPPYELRRVRGWDKHRPSQRRGALPTRSWLKRRRRWGVAGLVPRGRHGQDKSPATHRRWQGSGVVEDAVGTKDGQQLGLVGTWWSGQEKRGRPGIDGVLLVGGMGDGQLVVPVACAIRRPDPQGPGGPCRDKLTGVQGMLEACLAPLRRSGLARPPPVVGAARWCGDSPWRRPGRHQHQGTLLVEGKKSEVFP